ncbi:hypothetical protein Tco_0753398 [Tanacetum coccineum]
MVPRAVLMRTGLKTVKNAKPLSTVRSVNTVRHFSTAKFVNTVRPNNTAHPKPTVSCARPKTHFQNQAQRPFYKNTALTKRSNVQNINTVRPNVNTVRARGFNVVKPSACWVWRPIKPNGASLVFNKYNYIDARGRSKSVMAWVVSQMCDKKNYVLFTDSECLVLSPNFKLPDENQILLKIPRQNNMYSFDMKNIVPKDGLTCLVAKATSEESMKVQENLHVGFLENKPMLEGNGPKWLFDLDSLTQSMNYVPVVAGTFSNVSAASLKSVDALHNLQGSRWEYDDCSFQDDVSKKNQREFLKLLSTKTLMILHGSRYARRTPPFKLQNVWVLVDLPKDPTKKRAFDYDEVFAPVARIEAIRIFLVTPRKFPLRFEEWNENLYKLVLWDYGSFSLSSFSSDSSNESCGSPPLLDYSFLVISYCYSLLQWFAPENSLRIAPVISLSHSCDDGVSSEPHFPYQCFISYALILLMGHHRRDLMLLPMLRGGEGNSNGHHHLMSFYLLLVLLPRPGFVDDQRLLSDSGGLFLLGRPYRTHSGPHHHHLFPVIILPDSFGLFLLWDLERQIRLIRDLRLEMYHQSAVFLRRGPRPEGPSRTSVDHQLIQVSLSMPVNGIISSITRCDHLPPRKRFRDSYSSEASLEEDVEVGLTGTGVDMGLGIGDGDVVGDRVGIDHRDARVDTEEYEADASTGDTTEASMGIVRICLGIETVGTVGGRSLIASGDRARMAEADHSLEVWRTSDCDLLLDIERDVVSSLRLSYVPFTGEFRLIC